MRLLAVSGFAARVQPGFERPPQQLAAQVARPPRDRLPLDARDPQDLAAPVAVAARVRLSLADLGRTLPTASPKTHGTYLPGPAQPHKPASVRELDLGLGMEHVPHAEVDLYL